MKKLFVSFCCFFSAQYLFAQEYGGNNGGDTIRPYYLAESSIQIECMESDPACKAYAKKYDIDTNVLRLNNEIGRVRVITGPVYDDTNSLSDARRLKSGKGTELVKGEWKRYLETGINLQKLVCHERTIAYNNMIDENTLIDDNFELCDEFMAIYESYRMIRDMRYIVTQNEKLRLALRDELLSETLDEKFIASSSIYFNEEFQMYFAFGNMYEEDIVMCRGILEKEGIDDRQSEQYCKENASFAFMTCFANATLEVKRENLKHGYEDQIISSADDCNELLVGYINYEVDYKLKIVSEELIASLKEYGKSAIKLWKLYITMGGSEIIASRNILIHKDKEISESEVFIRQDITLAELHSKHMEVRIEELVTSNDSQGLSIVLYSGRVGQSRHFKDDLLEFNFNISLPGAKKSKRNQFNRKLSDSHPPAKPTIESIEIATGVVPFG